MRWPQSFWHAFQKQFPNCPHTRRCFGGGHGGQFEKYSKCKFDRNFVDEFVFWIVFTEFFST
jgi:hypothetical protein